MSIKSSIDKLNKKMTGVDVTDSAGISDAINKLTDNYDVPSPDLSDYYTKEETDELIAGVENMLVVNCSINSAGSITSDKTAAEIGVAFASGSNIFCKLTSENEYYNDFINFPIILPFAYVKNNVEAKFGNILFGEAYTNRYFVAELIINDVNGIELKLKNIVTEIGYAAEVINDSALSFETGFDVEKFINDIANSKVIDNLTDWTVKLNVYDSANDNYYRLPFTDEYRYAGDNDEELISYCFYKETLRMTDSMTATRVRVTAYIDINMGTNQIVATSFDIADL